MNKTVKILWVSSGILIFFWTAFWFWKVKILHEYGIVSNAIMLAIGTYLVLLYIIVAIVYFINRKLYKRKSLKIK